MAGPQINVCIPYDPEADLGREYNRLMRESQREWVLFLDHDVLLLNPHWHHICQEAIDKFPDAGAFTAWTANTGSTAQKLAWAPPPGSSIEAHQKVARRLWEKRGYQLTDVTAQPIAGFFLLTSVQAWRKAGGFPEGRLFGVDRKYQNCLTQAGLKIWRIDGLYVFHLRDRTRGSLIPGRKTSKELWTEYHDQHRSTV